MYRCPRDAIDLLDVPYRQVVKIEVHTKDREFTLTEEDILQGGLTIDRYSVSGSKIEIGSAVAGELTLKIKNDDGRFNDVRFEGAELNVWVGVKKWDAHRWENAQIYWIPCGYFIVDTPPRTLSTISLTALDRMVKFSKEVDTWRLSFPIEIEGLINRCCTLCGVVCGSDLTKLINRRYVVKELPQTTSETLTYRQLIAWAAEITGTCAYVDWDGQLRFAWYEDTGEVFDGSRRYSSDLYESDVVITGVTFTDNEERHYAAGNGDYMFDMSGNSLLQSDYRNVVDTVYVARKDFAYRPYEAVVKPAPYLWPMDMIHFIDKDGNDHVTIVTHVTFTLNTATSIAGVGQTEQNDGYAVGGLTANQRRILEAMQREQHRDLSSREQALIALNEMIGGSLGLYYTEVESDNGTPLRYFHNAKTLEDSNIIYTFGANGFAWTSDWNDGKPVWQYGFTKDGNAVYNALAAYKISAEYIEAHSITAELLSSEYISKTEQDLADVFDGANGYTDEKLKGYLTSEETKTAIKQSASDITLEVSTKYQTIADANNRVPGSGNMVLGSTNFKLIDGKWVDTGGCAADKKGSYTISGEMVHIQNVNQNTRYGFTCDKSKIKKGVSYCVSVLYKPVSGADSLMFQFEATDDNGTTISWYQYPRDKQKTIEQGDGWKLVYATFTATKDANANILFLSCGPDYQTVTSDYYLMHPQVCEGNTPSAWSPAASDYTRTTEIRSRFAMDSSSVTIESGVISFKSNTITIDSDNFKLNGNGEVTAKGNFTSEGKYGTSKLYGGNIAFDVFGEYHSSINSGFGMDGSTTYPHLSLNTGALTLDCPNDLTINTNKLDVHNGYNGLAYAGQSVTKSYISDFTTKTYDLVAVSRLQRVGDGFSWDTTTYHLPLPSSWTNHSMMFVKGIMVTA